MNKQIKEIIGERSREMREWKNSFLAFLLGKVYSNGVIFCRRFAQSGSGAQYTDRNDGDFSEKETGPVGFCRVCRSAGHTAQEFV